MPIRANALAIMAKAPVAGAVKTRLVPPLTSQQAADFYGALLLDQFEHLSQFKAAERFIFYTPADGEPIMRGLGGDHYSYRAQLGDDLGERMARVFAELWAGGFRNMVLIGSDLPALPLTIIDQAFAELADKQRRVVLGPSEDGGYYLVGMNQPTPEIFADMTWSHDQVLADTTARLKRLRVAHHLLAPWFDLDCADDFSRLGHLAQSETQALGRTKACLEAIGYWPASKV